MWFFSRAADWWDEKKREASEYLHEFVDEHPHWWAIAIAGTVETSMRLGGGFVDVLRLGDGIRQGTWRGALSDGLRLLSVAGPLARVGRGIARFVVPNPSGGVCAWVSATQVLRQTGVQHFATIEDIVAATGKTPGAATMADVEQMLKDSGADVRALPRPADISAVKALAQANPRGVVMFGVNWIRSVGGILKTEGHALYAYRTIFGGVKIIDRTGRAVEALSELEPGVKLGYPGISQAQPIAARLVKNAQAVTLIDGTSAVAVESRALILADRKTADASFARFKALRNAGYGSRTAAQPHKFVATPKKQAPSGKKKQAPSGNRPISQPAPVNASPAATGSAHAVHTVKVGETWESILRPFWNTSSPISFYDFVSEERATNRLMGHVSETGELKPGLKIWIY